LRRIKNFFEKEPAFCQLY